MYQTEPKIVTQNRSLNLTMNFMNLPPPVVNEALLFNINMGDQKEKKSNILSGYWKVIPLGDDKVLQTWDSAEAV